jgi:hypothetical protein
MSGLSPNVVLLTALRITIPSILEGNTRISDILFKDFRHHHSLSSPVSCIGFGASTAHADSSLMVLSLREAVDDDLSFQIRSGAGIADLTSS